VKRTILTAAATSLATVAAAMTLAGPAHAVAPIYNYMADAGATQVNAIGVTVQSNATAESRITGFNSASASNSILGASAGALLSAGVASTSTTATVNSSTGGVTVVAHARTANVSLLGGLVTAQAIDTTATTVADGTHTPTTSITTNLVGLSVNGQAYPVSVAPNTGITIPGILSIALNAQVIGTSGSSAIAFGAGLRVTLLSSTNGASAGAEISVNPIAEILQPGGAELGGFPLGGMAYGSFVHANVGSSVQVVSDRTAVVAMPLAGTGGQEQINSTAAVNVNGVLNLGAIQNRQTGVRGDALSQSTENASVANVNLFGGLITAKAVQTTATASVRPSGSSESGGMTLLGLTVAGQAIPLNVAPNTKIHVANLGTVTINEQQDVAVPGVAHAFLTIGVHVVLDTAKAGLPVGAEVELATSQAIVWQ
jgi:hypothetical protein